MRRFTLIATSTVFAFCALPVHADEVRVSPNPETLFVIAPVQPTATPQADGTEDFAPHGSNDSKSVGGAGIEPTGNTLGPIQSYFYSVSVSPFDFGLHRTGAAGDGVFELGFGEFVAEGLDADADVEDQGPEAFSAGDSGAPRGATGAGGGMQFAMSSGEMTAGQMFAGPQLPLGNGMFLSFPAVSPFATTGAIDAHGMNDNGPSADSKRIGSHILRFGKHKKDSDGGNGGENGDPPTSDLPEPATMLLTGAGLFGLALKRRR